MQINKVTTSRGVHSIREMVETFREDRLDCPALKMRKGQSSPVISTTAPAHNKPGSVGLPLANVEVRIENPDENGNGEVLARGSNIMLGYYNMPEKPREVIDAGGCRRVQDPSRLRGLPGGAAKDVNSQGEALHVRRGGEMNGPGRHHPALLPG